MKISKKYLTLLLLVYIGIFWPFLQYGINNIFSYWDELLAFFGAVSFLVHFNVINKDKYYRTIICLVLIFGGCGLLGNVIWGYTKIAYALSDFFINIKFFLCLFLTITIYRKHDLLEYSHKITRHLNIISLFLLLAFLFDQIFHVFPVYEIRFGLKSEQLFFAHPTFYASSLFYLLMLRILFVRKKEKLNFFLNIVLSIMVAFSFRFKAIAVIMLFYAIYLYTVLPHLKKIKTLVILFVIGAVWVVSQEQLKFYFSGYGLENFPRGVLLLTSLNIIKDYFPFGTGFGTFGSYVSGEHYSPVYKIYHIANIDGIRKENINAITDQYWPMIGGQTGLIGLVCMILIWSILLIKIKKLKVINSRYYIVAISSFLYLLCSSTSESAICNPACIPLAVVLGLIFSQNIKKGVNYESKNHCVISSTVPPDRSKR